MAAQANCMFFAPTATDTIVQNAYGSSGANPLAFVNAMTRTGVTVNSVPGFAYQGDMGDVFKLASLVADLFSKR